MTIERDIEQAFERHSTDVEPTPGEWSALQQRVRRSHRVRVATFSTLGVAAVIAAAMVVPKLVDRPSAAPVINPAPSQSSAPTPSASLSVQPVTYRDDDAGWTISYDGTWSASTFEGVTDFVPDGLKAPAVGQPTAAISIQVLGERYDKGAPKNHTVERFAGRDSVVTEETMPSGERRRVYRIDWTGIGCPPRAPCPMPSGGETTLYAAVYAGSAALWQQWSTAMLDAIKDTLRPAEPIARTTATVRTKHGAVRTGVKYDDRTVSVVRFLNARIEQGGAEDFLTSNAKKNYDDTKNMLGLYATSSTSGSRDFYTRYEVVEREDADASSSEFTVHLFWDHDGNPGELAETIGVGAGTSVTGKSSYPIIRFAKFVFTTCPSCPPYGPPQPSVSR